MSEAIWGVLGVIVGGLLSAGTAWLVAWQGNKSAATLQAEQLAHERAERRFDGAVRTYVDFAIQMQASELAASLFEDQRGYTYADDTWGPDAESRAPIDRPAENALERLRLLVPEELYDAGRLYLDAHYWRWYDVANAPDDPTPVAAAESAFIRTARRALHLDEASSQG